MLGLASMDLNDLAWGCFALITLGLAALAGFLASALSDFSVTKMQFWV
jgi:hypothetical protein